MLKVGESMRHVLADILQRGDLGESALEQAIISVSEVRVSPDLRHAIAFVMPIGADDERQQQVLAALNRHNKQIRHEMARRVNTKYAADLEFRLDESFAEAARIDAILRTPKVARDLAEQALSEISPEDEDGQA